MGLTTSTTRSRGSPATCRLRRDLVTTEARNARLQAENERLAREAEALRSDMRAVENVARADLGWVKPGEVIFELGRNP